MLPCYVTKPYPIELTAGQGNMLVVRGVHVMNRLRQVLLAIRVVALGRQDLRSILLVQQRHSHLVLDVGPSTIMLTLAMASTEVVVYSGHT
jgi:hypothetical protein